jgi:hypothetical protein
VERGDVAVEDLRVGERVLTASGALRPIIWIGHRDLDVARHPAPAEIRPVRVCKDAFGENLPRRDLWLSPHHAVLIDGALFPIIRLTNGATISQQAVERVSYWHVELESHDVLLAENLPAESYLDCGNRNGFANGGCATELHPDFKPKAPADSCAPVLVRGERMAAVRRRLTDIAEGFGFVATRDPALHLLADCVALWPEKQEGGRYHFTVEGGAKTIRLVSRTWTPADMIPDSEDRRLLGVVALRIVIDGHAIDLAELGDGWSRNESDGSCDWRWTEGSAALPPGSQRIEIEIASDAIYWTGAPKAAVRAA